MKRWKEVHYCINGNKIDARFNLSNEEEIWHPLLRHWTQLAKEKNRRILIFLAGACGSGKSTLASYLQELSQQWDDVDEIQSIGMDGFHRRQSELKTMSLVRGGKTIGLSEIKGCPESFDFLYLKRKLDELKNQNEVYFPIYDRTLHDPMEDQVLLHRQIILIEGNYLLLDQPPWNRLEEYADDSIQIIGRLEDLKERLIERKALNSDYATAVQFYHFSDSVNAKLIAEHSKPARVQLRLLEDDDLELLKK